MAKVMQNIKVAVDAVVFGYDGTDVSVLLIKRNVNPFKGDWALPGGLVLGNENLEQAVKRELKEETNLAIDYLEQLFTYGDVGRDPRNRVVSVAYFGMVRPSKFQLKAATDAIDAQWFPIHHLPKLAFDHAKIVKMALGRLRAKLSYQPIGFNLLDAKFPFGALENLYMAILGREIDRRNFRKKILSFRFIEETEEWHTAAKGRPGKLFQFNTKKYKEFEANGFLFEI
jgi:8-oxo-dGTP diphosphatase